MLTSIYLFALLELLVVSYLDYKTKKIANWWSIINVLLFIVTIILFPQNYKFSMNLLTMPALFLGLGFILFYIRIAGAGDVKFLSTFFLLIPLHLHLEMTELILISTIVVALLLILKNTIKNSTLIVTIIKERQWLLLQGIYGTKFSYSPVILLAWVWLWIKTQLL
ncbi:MAG: hypothetical protein HQK50_04280 [Oligoflexia bacterium]|nr:hypothetical protein [Oligoflexia bacterium]MBF0364762.1 hypothetical protein [Oligoflexia bacterium]